MLTAGRVLYPSAGDPPQDTLTEPYQERARPLALQQLLLLLSAHEAQDEPRGGTVSPRSPCPPPPGPPAPLLPILPELFEVLLEQPQDPIQPGPEGEAGGTVLCVWGWGVSGDQGGGRCHGTTGGQGNRGDRHRSPWRTWARPGCSPEMALSL